MDERVHTLVGAGEGDEPHFPPFPRPLVFLLLGVDMGVILREKFSAESMWQRSTIRAIFSFFYLFSFSRRSLL